MAPQAPAALQAAPAAPAAAVQAAPTVYTVVPGDCLSEIAAERGLSGGWQRLYAENREAVGSNPSLIHPGLKLTLGGRGEAAAPVEAVPAPRTAPEAAPKAAPKAPKAPKPAGRAAAPQAQPESAPEAPAAQPAAAGFVAPVSGGISTQYKVAGAMWSSGYHTGVDFIAAMGTSVKAVGAGTVVSAGWSGAYGNEVVIRHADGKYSQYAHLSQLSVSSGQSVTAGQSIGLSGSTGNSTGPHLHFEIRTSPSYGSDMDPIAYLRSKGASL